jgi:hypothetical protein
MVAAFKLISFEIMYAWGQFLRDIVNISLQGQFIHK